MNKEIKGSEHCLLILYFFITVTFFAYFFPQDYFLISGEAFLHRLKKCETTSTFWNQLITKGRVLYMVLYRGHFDKGASQSLKE